MTMFDDDPVRRGRLEAALDRLPDGDQPRRVELLGRLSVAELGRGDLWPQARRHADAAIAMARRLGDPELIATALVDRHLTTMDGADLEARAAAADELVELGERARRPDRVLVGQQWRYGAALSRGDLAGATAVLDDTEVLAALMPSPEWTYGVLLRRALIAAIEGDHATALALVEQSRPLGDRVLWPDEALGLDLGARTLIQRITGIVDPALPALHDEFAAMSTIPQKAYFQSHVAASALAAGDRDTAEQMVHRLAGKLARVETPAEAPATILLVAALVARLGLREHAACSPAPV